MHAPRRFIFLLTSLGFLSVLNQPSAGAEVGDPMVSLMLKGRPAVGMSLLWTPARAVVLQQDGRLLDFDPADASRAAAISGSFEPASRADLRNRLYAEFGAQYQVSATANYLVVHPHNRKHWPDVLERLHRAFLQYCGTRGLMLRKGRFPMVAIVFPDRASFLRYAQADRIRPLVGNVLGYYSRNSNRVALYDHGQSAGGVSSTLRHEAVHQSAFNWGIHSRVARQPHWIVEGFGTMFEAEGIHDAAKNRTLTDRVNALMLNDLRELIPNNQSLAAAIDELIGEDQPFSTAPRRAYAVSWALTFYLADRRPDVLRQLVSLYSSRAPFIGYTAQERHDDFQQALGISTPMLASQIQQFLSEVR